jgi:hypothetical protein
MCLLEAGKLLESQNKKDEALQIYERIKKDYPAAAIVNNEYAPAEIDKFIERAKN